jgi:hypothetical protein
VTAWTVNAVPCMKIRLLKHTAAPAVPDSGSYEVKFPDGRPGVYFYWDDNPGRRSITMALSSEEAERKAKDLRRNSRQVFGPAWRCWTLIRTFV